MGAVRFKHSSSGIKKMLKSKKAAEIVGTAAEGLALRAGKGFGVHRSNRGRARAYVRAETPAARRKQARQHVLERVMGGGGGDGA